MTDNQEPEAVSSPLGDISVAVAPEVERLYARRVLTPRKRRMIEAYVRHGTYTAAARASGMSSSTVKKQIENNAHVQKAIGELVDQAAMVTGVTLERVLQEYARIAFSDIGEVVALLREHRDPDAAIAVLADLPADVTAAISKIEISRKADGEGGFETGALKVHFWDKKGALSDLGRVLAMFKDRVTLDVTDFGEMLRKAEAKMDAIEHQALAAPDDE